MTEFLSYSGLIDSNGNQGVSLDAKVGTRRVHFSQEITAAASNFILVDLSDTTNYKHLKTNFLHIGDLRVFVDAETNAEYSIDIGYLENVDGTDGDFIVVYHIAADKQSGNSMEHSYMFQYNGPQLHSDYTVSSTKSLNDVVFNTGALLPSTLDPSSANVAPGDNDMVMRITKNTGGSTAITVNVDFSFHSH